MSGKSASDLRAAGWSGAGSVAAALAAAGSWICCLPFVAGVAGVAAAATSLLALRPWLTAAAVLLLGLGFYRAYRHEDCEGTAACASPRRRRRTRALLWLATVVVLLLATLPQWSSWVLYWSL